MKPSLIISLILVAGTLVSCGSDSGTSTTTTTYTRSTPDGACSDQLVHDHNSIASEMNLFSMTRSRLATQPDSYENFKDFIIPYRRVERTCGIFKKNHQSMKTCTAIVNYKEKEVIPQDIITECDKMISDFSPLVKIIIEKYPDLAQI